MCTGFHVFGAGREGQAGRGLLWMWDGDMKYQTPGKGLRWVVGGGRAHTYTHTTLLADCPVIPVCLHTTS